MKRVAGLNARVTHLSRNTQWRNENILVIRLKRAYELPARSDGCRVLVDRLWPRGVSKGRAEYSVLAQTAGAKVRCCANGSTTILPDGPSSKIVISENSMAVGMLLHFWKSWRTKRSLRWSLPPEM